ncbi:MAG: type II secretion system protein [Methyloprofundus sp.]|nr:type II secretion system protein [Methyloprofundus sp.]
MAWVLTQHPPTLGLQPKRQTGFTLLELLVVITLLAIVAGVALVSYEGVQASGRADATRFEMAEIRKALLQFRRDSGSHDFPGQGIYDCTDDVNGGNITDKNALMTFPAEAGSNDADIIAWCQHPANFWMLFTDPLGKGWNPDTKRGWNGPYLQRKSGYVDVGDDLQQNGLGSPIMGTPIKSLWGIADPYLLHTFIAADNDEHLAWRAELTQSDAYAKHGRPYLLFGMDTDETDDDRIVSMGEDGVYGGTGSEICLPPLDDVTNEPVDQILCLLR